MVDYQLIITSDKLSSFAVVLLKDKWYVLGFVKSDAVQALLELMMNDVISEEIYEEMHLQLIEKLPEKRRRSDKLTDALENLLVKIFSHDCGSWECQLGLVAKVISFIQLGQSVTFEDLHEKIT